MRTKEWTVLTVQKMIGKFHNWGQISTFHAPITHLGRRNLVMIGKMGESKYQASDDDAGWRKSACLKRDQQNGRRGRPANRDLPPFYTILSPAAQFQQRVEAAIRRTGWNSGILGAIAPRIPQCKSTYKFIATAVHETRAGLHGARLAVAFPRISSEWNLRGPPIPARV
jgi:hypothetical protein